MKALKVAFRFILMLVVASANLYLNAYVIRHGIYFLRTLAGFWPVMGIFALMAYLFFQMILFAYLLYWSLKRSCIKYNIPYR